MVINIVLPSIGASGGIDVIYKYVGFLKSRGHDVCVYKELQASNMHRYQSEIKNKIHQRYCTIKAVLQKKRWKHQEDVFVLKLTNRTVRDADVIIATAWPTAYKVASLSEKKGRKYYFIQDYEVWDNDKSAKKSYELPLNKIVISSWINNCLKRDLGIGPFPVVYNGLDLDIFHPVDVKKDENTISFLMLNHTLPKKGVKNGLEVFERVRRKYKQCKLYMFGMCDSSNIPDYVEYYQNPSKSQLVKLYSKADIFIFPSLEEGWGMTPLEAMACGCVVVGSNVGFVLDFGKNKQNMMISEPGDIDGMVRNIEEILGCLTLHQHIQVRMKQDIKLLNWECSSIKLEKLMNNYESN